MSAVDTGAPGRHTGDAVRPGGGAGGGPPASGGSGGAGGGPPASGGSGGAGGGPPTPGGRRDGGAAGYRPHATLTFATELRRQVNRRRTQLALGFMVLLPLIVLAAFQFGNDGEDGGEGGRFGSVLDVATAGGLNFTLFTLLVSASFLLVVVVALFCGDTVASDASWGSLRYLLAVPVPRARLLGSKLLVSLTLSALALVLLTVTALAAGTLRYGWHPLRSTVTADVAPGPGLARIALIVAYLAVNLLIVAGLAFLLSVLTDAALGAVGGAVLLNILSSILDQITALGSLRNVLPTHYADAWLGVLSTPVQTADMVSGAIVALCYAALFFTLAWYRFLRKDITS